MLARIVEVQRAQKAILDKTKESRVCHHKKHDQQNNATDNTKGRRKVTQSNCRYCSNIWKPHKCPVYGRNCTKCSRATPFEFVWRSHSRKVSIEYLQRKVHSSLQHLPRCQGKRGGNKGVWLVWSNIFNFHGKRSVIITKLTKKSN